VWFVFTGLRLGRRRLLIAGVVYAMAFLALLVGSADWLVTYADNGFEPWVRDQLVWVLFSWLLLTGISAIHFFAIRPRYA
jgi:hypothetical protein